MPWKCVQGLLGLVAQVGEHRLDPGLLFKFARSQGLGLSEALHHQLCCFLLLGFFEVGVAQRSLQPPHLVCRTVLILSCMSWY